MESIPIGRRTRLQQAIKDKDLREEKRKRWFAARSNWRNRVTGEVNSRDGHDYNEECNIDEDRSIPKDDRNDKDSDESLQIIAERWNPDECYESHSSAASSDSDDEIMSSCRGAEHGVGNSKEMAAIACEQVSDFGSSFKDKDGKDVNDEDGDHIGVCNGGMAHVNELKSKDGHNSMKRERVSNAGVFRSFDGLILPRKPENNARQIDFVSRRTRSHFKPKFHMRKKDGTFSCPVAIDDGTPSSSDGDKDEGHEMPEKTNSCENAIEEKRGRSIPRRTAYVENESESENDPEPEIATKHEDDKEGESAVKRKRGRPPKNRNVVKESRPKKKRGRLETNEVENIMLNTVLENGNARLESLVSSVSESSLPLKFNFRGKNLLSVKSEADEVEGLFSELQFDLRACDVSCSKSCLDGDAEEDKVHSYESAVVQTKLCRQGMHYLILEDEIGIRCKCCPFVKLEIRDVTPAFDDRTFGRSIIKQEQPLDPLR